MTIAIIAALLISLGLYVLPAYLSRQKRIDSPSEHFVSARPASKSVFTNASVAYAIQLATFGPFFVWGAMGDYWPGLINTVFFGLGLFLILLFRRPIMSFLASALAADNSVTIHGFISKSHGNSRLVRVTASCLTIFALWGIVMAEMFGASALIGPLIGSDIDLTYILVIVMFFLMFVYTTAGGNDGVMRADQFQLGVAYLCLFAAFAIMLWTLAAQGAITAGLVFPIGLFALVLTVLIAVRRLRFIDYSVNAIADTELADDPAMLKTAQVYRVLERGLNWLVVAAVLACVIAVGRALLAADWQNAGASASEALARPSSLSALALFSLAILPLLYQICDTTNWQRLAALRPEQGVDDPRLKRALLTYSLEAPAIWLSMMLFGAVAVAYLSGFNMADPINGFVAKLMSTDTASAPWVLGFLLLAGFAIALSTMDAVLSATLYAFRYDILSPVFGDGAGSSEGARVRTVNRFGLLTYLVVIGMFFVAEHNFQFGRSQYLGLLLGFYSAQISFLPLLVGGIVNREGQSPFWDAGPMGALATLVAGFVAGVGLTIAGLFGGGDELLWAGIPASLGASTIAYLLSCGVRRAASPRVN